MNASSRPWPDLNKLEISLNRSECSTKGGIAFELLVRGASASRVEATLDEIGFSSNFSYEQGEYRERDPKFRIPEKVTTGLRDALSARGIKDEPLWIELKPPSSILTLAPWEQLLQEQLGLQLLRLS